MSKWRIVPFLLVLTLVLCPTADGRPLLDLNHTQDVYQAEEHSNVTLTLLSPVNTTSDSLYIDVMNVEQQRCIYRYDSRIQADPYTDDVFRDRLQCDPQLDVNREIYCFLTDLRLSDAGIYQCIVAANGRSHLKKWELVIRAVMHQTQKEPPNQPARERVGMYMALGLFAVVISLLPIRCYCFRICTEPVGVVCFAILWSGLLLRRASPLPVGL